MNTTVAKLKDKVDFGIITIREDEFEAVLQRLPTQQVALGHLRYAISRLKTIDGDEYVIASVRCTEPGPGVAQDIARTMIEELNPQWLLVVGIAGSMPDYEYTLGDVNLATRLHDFSVSAVIENDNGEVRRELAVGGGPMHPEVQSLLAILPALNERLGEWYSPSSLTVSRPEVSLDPVNFYGDDTWQEKVKERLSRYFGPGSSRQRPKAFTGSVVSSGTLLKDTQTATEWLRISRDIKSIEMELAGVYQAAWRYHKPVLSIRGLSDVVGFQRSPEWTTYACHTAAAYAVALLHSRPNIPLESKESSRVEESQTFVAAREINVKNGGVGSEINNAGEGTGLEVVNEGKGPAERITVEGQGTGERIINTGSGTGKRIISTGGGSGAKTSVTATQPVKQIIGMSSMAIIIDCQKCGRPLKTSIVIQGFAGDLVPPAEIKCQHCGAITIVHIPADTEDIH